MAATTTATARLALVNGIELAYQTQGSGRPLVLLHGAFGSVKMYGPNVAALAAGREVIGVDLQSHGRTPAIDRSMGFEILVLRREVGRNALKPSSRPYQRSSVCSRPGSATMATACRL